MSFVDHLEVRHYVRFEWKSPQQRLTKCVDSPYLKSVGRIHSFHEQAARAGSLIVCGLPAQEARNLSSSTLASEAAQSPRRSCRRFAISAAAALVKVRQRIRSGRVPVSRRRVILSIKTRVLPVPALAETHTDCPGSAARAWAPVSVSACGAVLKACDFAHATRADVQGGRSHQTLPRTLGGVVIGMACLGPRTC